MAVDGFAIDPHAADEVKQALTALTEELAENLKTLNQSVNTFASKNSGPDVEEYQSAQGNWNNGLENVRETLGGHSRTLGAITENYGVMAQQQARLFRS
jgi:uncharacterized protein YukE